MKILEGKINNGLDDVAKYLGLNKEKTIFMHSTSFDESTKEGKKRAAINKGRMLYSEILSYSSSTKNGAKSAVAYYNKELLDYMHRNNIINIDNIIQVGEEKKVDFPYNSVSLRLNNEIKSNEELRKKLDGYTIVSSYLSVEDMETAQLINGKTLMDVNEQLRFNSKFEMRRMSEKYKFAIPEGVNLLGVDNIENKINELKNKCKSKLNKGKAWVKLESQSSGAGNIIIEDIYNCDIDILKEKIIKTAEKIYDKDYIKNEMPLTIEIDVNSLKDEEEIENIGVEAVIREDAVTILGGVSQKAVDGKYIGSEVTPNTYKYLEIAKNAAADAFTAYAKEGYKGFMTIDVLITINNKTQEIKAYNIDPNARFSAGTMLLKSIHAAEVQCNKKMYGVSFSNGIKIKEGVYKSIETYCGDNLYRGKDSEYKGIMPVVLNDVNTIGNGLYYLKTIVVEDSYEKAIEVYNKFKENIRNA